MDADGSELGRTGARYISGALTVEWEEEQK
jgi:hypothetical protein